MTEENQTDVPAEESNDRPEGETSETEAGVATTLPPEPEPQSNPVSWSKERDPEDPTIATWSATIGETAYEVRREAGAYHINANGECIGTRDTLESALNDCENQ